MTKVKESNIEEAICDFLELIPRSHVTKIAPTGFFDGGKMRKHKSRHVKNGLADIFFWTYGRFYAFEVKTPAEYKHVMKHYQRYLATPRDQLNKKGQHLKDQIMFLESMRLLGHTGEFVCNVEMVRNILLKN